VGFLDGYFVVLEAKSFEEQERFCFNPKFMYWSFDVFCPAYRVDVIFFFKVFQDQRFYKFVHVYVIYFEVWDHSGIYRYC